MGTVGTINKWKVASADLTDPADITTAFKVFYEGDTEQSPAMAGLESIIVGLDGRIFSLESNPVNVEFPTTGSTPFRLYDSTKKLAFGISTLSTGTTTINIKAGGDVVLHDYQQSLSNKTLDTTNTINADPAKFNLKSLGAGYLNFVLPSFSSNKTLTVPNITSSGDTLVLENTVDQIISSKILKGYKESISTVTTFGVNSVQASAFNLIYANPSSVPSNGSVTVDILGMQNGASVFVIFKGHTSYTVTPVIKVDGTTTIKWAGGASPAAITANAAVRYALVSITKIDSGVFVGTFLGEYY